MDSTGSWKEDTLHSTDIFKSRHMAKSKGIHLENGFMDNLVVVALLDNEGDRCLNIA